jgi:hypothetical protein
MFMGANDILDTKIFYTSNESSDFFKGLSAAGVAKYKRIALVDLLLFIPTYTTLLYLFSKRFLPKRFVYASFVPGLFDIVETLAVLLFLSSVISEFPPWMGYITLLKWVSGYMIGIAIGANLYKKIRA